MTDGLLLPHIIAESSPGKHHAYWCVDDIGLDEFSSLQRQLAQRFDGDANVHDLPRVMRLPGFLHPKAAPFRSRIILCNDDGSRYCREDFFKAFRFKPEPPRPFEPECPLVVTTAQVVPLSIPAIEGGGIPQGKRNASLFDLARGFRDKGFAEQDAKARLLKINVTKCQPPLPEAEVLNAVRSAYSFAATGFMLTPHAVVDSPKWKALSPVAVKLLDVVLRRYNGNNNGNISLTEAELWSEGKGLRDPKASRKARRELLAAGFLKVERPAIYGERGKVKQCALYRLPFLDDWKPPRRRGPT